MKIRVGVACHSDASNIPCHTKAAQEQKPQKSPKRKLIPLQEDTKVSRKWNQYTAYLLLFIQRRVSYLGLFRAPVNSTDEVVVPAPYPQVSMEFDVGMCTFTSYRRYTGRHLAWVDTANVFREDRTGWGAGVKMKKSSVFSCKLT